MAPHLQSLLHIGVEVKKTQGANFFAIFHHGDQLSTRPECHLTRANRGFKLHHLAITGIGQFDQSGFVFVAVGQVQGQVHIANQTHFAQGLLRGAQGFNSWRWRGGHPLASKATAVAQVAQGHFAQLNQQQQHQGR